MMGAAMAETPDTRAQAAFDARRESRRDLVRDTAEEFLARAQLGRRDRGGFRRALDLFWANAFTASSTKFQAAVFMGQYEREAIRPHVFGRFEDLRWPPTATRPCCCIWIRRSRSGRTVRPVSGGRRD